MEISVHVCILDGTPPHESDCYRTLCEILGEHRAKRWVDEVTFKPPDEVNLYDRPADLVMGREGKYQFLGRGGVSSQAGYPSIIQTPTAG